MISAYASEDDMVKHVAALGKKRNTRDMKELIKVIMETPLTEGKAYSVDDVKSISELSKLNTDLRTRIILSVANDAARGDTKAAELLFKYGGYMPVIEQNVSIRLPQIINDLSPPGQDEDLIDVTPEVEQIEAPNEVAPLIEAIAGSGEALKRVRDYMSDDDEDEVISMADVKFADDV